MAASTVDDGDNSWRYVLKVGSLLDVQDTNSQWLPAKVIEYTRTHHDISTVIRIHCKCSYCRCFVCQVTRSNFFSTADLGWGHRWDENLTTTDRRLAPFLSHGTLPLPHCNDPDCSLHDYLDDPRVFKHLDLHLALQWQCRAISFQLKNWPGIAQDHSHLMVRTLLDLKANPTAAFGGRSGCQDNLELTLLLLRRGADVNKTQVLLRIFQYLPREEDVFSALLEHNAAVFVPLAPSQYEMQLGGTLPTSSGWDYVRQHYTRDPMRHGVMMKFCDHVRRLIEDACVFDTATRVKESALRSRPLLNLVWEYVHADPWKLVIERSDDFLRWFQSRTGQSWVLLRDLLLQHDKLC